jgi:hypothetical protein
MTRVHSQISSIGMVELVGTNNVGDALSRSYKQSQSIGVSTSKKCAAFVLLFVGALLALRRKIQ